MKKTYLLNILLFCLMLIFVMLMTGCVRCFFDIGSLLMVVLSTIFMLLANFGFSDIRKNFKLGFKKERIEPSELKNGIIFFTTMQKYLGISGAIGVMMGLIAMLASLENPEKIGQGLALSLITVLYALFFSMAVAVPFKAGLEKRLIENEAGSNL